VNEYEKLLEILNSNANKSFVKRILHKGQYPTLDNGDGTVSTHSMSWGDADGRYFVYPTVLYTKDKTLKRYNNDAAWIHAMQTGNFIEFHSPQEADWFSKNYKKIWDEQ